MKSKPVFDERDLDEVAVAAEKFGDLMLQDANVQAKAFAERYVFMLQPAGMRKLFALVKDFELALSRHWGPSNNAPNRMNSAVPLGLYRQSSNFSQFSDRSTSRFGVAAKSRSIASFRNSSVGSVGTLLDVAETHLPLNSTQLTWFLQKQSKVKMHSQRKAAFGGLLTPEGDLPLIGYLLFHYRREILTEYYLRRKVPVPRGVTGQFVSKPLGNQKVGYELDIHDNPKTLATALIEEFFLRFPLGVDPVLDEGLFEYTEIVWPMQRDVVQLKSIEADPSMSAVKRHAARAELHGLIEDLKDAFDTSYVLIDAYAKRLKQRQKEAVNKQIDGLFGKKMKRQMTLARFSTKPT